MSRVWSLRPTAHRRRSGRGLGAALLSALVPGVGQLALGEQRRGVTLLTGTLTIGAGLGWLTSLGTVQLGALFARPPIIGGLVLANTAMLAFRLFAALDAYRLGSRPPAEPALPRRPANVVAVVVALALIAMALATPHAMVGYYLLVTRESLPGLLAGSTPGS